MFACNFSILESNGCRSGIFDWDFLEASEIIKMWQQSKNWLWIGVALLSSGALAIDARAEESITLRIESVVLRPMQEAEVPAEQTGLLQKIVVVEGQQVRKGEVLATLDARKAKLAVARAQLEYELAKTRAENEIQTLYAEKALEVAEAELRRSSESIKEFAKSISQSQLDVEQLTVEKLMLERQQAEHERVLERFGVRLKQTELEAARLQLDQHRLLAPFDGTVVMVRGRVGEWVEVGASVMRLMAVEKLRAEGFLSAEQATAELVGRPVLFKTASGGKTMETLGVLRFVSPEIEPITRQVRVWAEFPSGAGKLRPGEKGTLLIQP